MKKLKQTFIYKIINDIATVMNMYHVGAYASSAAFFTFLSLIPMMLLFFSIIPYTPITEATIMKGVAQLLPAELLPLSIRIINEMYHTRAALLSITLLATLWSSGKGTLALIRGLNVINNVTERRNYFLLRLRACIYTIVMLVILIGLIVIVIFGESIMHLTANAMPQLQLLFDFFIQIRVVFVIGILALFFWAVFTWLPSDDREKKEKTREKTKHVKRGKSRVIYELPGALFTAFVWYLASWIFSGFVNRFSAFSTYGSMATIVIIMFWLYMCFYIIFVGAIINSIIKRALTLRRMKKQALAQGDISKM